MNPSDQIIARKSIADAARTVSAALGRTCAQIGDAVQSVEGALTPDTVHKLADVVALLALAELQLVAIAKTLAPPDISLN